MQQSFSREMESLFLGESFQVACSSVLKEMAVSCDLTALEEVTPFLYFSQKKYKIIYENNQCRVRPEYN